MPQAESTDRRLRAARRRAARLAGARGVGSPSTEDRPREFPFPRKIFLIFRITSESDCNKIYTVLIFDPD